MHVKFHGLKFLFFLVGKKICGVLIFVASSKVGTIVAKYAGYCG